MLVVRVCGSNGVVCMLSPEYADGDGRVRGMSGMDTNMIYSVKIARIERHRVEYFVEIEINMNSCSMNA